MPIFWRYLLTQYFKVLILTLLSFVAILVISQLSEIAELTSFGSNLPLVLLFVFLQVPYLLPLAIPISALVSSMILMRSLSLSYELTALRASGFSMKASLAPLIVAACVLSMANFYIGSELATSAHLKCRKMINQISSSNPLILLRNAEIAKLKTAYVQMDMKSHGVEAKDLLIAIPGKKGGFNLALAKKVKIKGEDLLLQKATVISSFPSNSDLLFDHLMIENQTLAKSKAPEFAEALKKKKWKISNDHLKFSLLLAKMKTRGANFFEKNTQKCLSEIARRFWLGLAPLSFTLIGACFGIESLRNQTKKNIIFVSLIAAFLLITFFIAKELDSLFLIAFPIFFIPQGLAVWLSLKHLRRAT